MTRSRTAVLGLAVVVGFGHLVPTALKWTVRRSWSGRVRVALLALYAAMRARCLDGGLLALALTCAVVLFLRNLRPAGVGVTVSAGLVVIAAPVAVWRLSDSIPIAI